VSRCVLDTDVVIGALDRQDAHHANASSLLLGMLDTGISLHLSVINYAETLVRPAQERQALRRAVDAIASLRIELESPTPAIARDAARLRGLGISLADGFALATAQQLGAVLATFDARVRTAAATIGLVLP